MREDMYKVIVERPRRGGSYSRDGRRFRASEDAPTKIGIRKGYGSRKSLNENLAPLRRYLERQAGRPWDRVFSDICAVIDNRDTVRQRVRTHIEDFVAVKTRIEKGQVVTRRWRLDGKFVPLSEVFQE